MIPALTAASPANTTHKEIRIRPHFRPFLRQRLLRLIGCALLLLAAPAAGFAQGQPSQLLLKDINPGAAGSEPQLLAARGDQAFFTAVAPDAGRELWASDGTPEGTGLVIDLAPGPASRPTPQPPGPAGRPPAWRQRPSSSAIAALPASPSP